MLVIILSGHYLIFTLILWAKYCYILKLQRRKLRHREVEQLPRVSKSDIWAGSLGRPISPGVSGPHSWRAASFSGGLAAHEHVWALCTPWVEGAMWASVTTVTKCHLQGGGFYCCSSFWGWHCKALSRVVESGSLQLPLHGPDCSSGHKVPGTACPLGEKVTVFFLPLSASEVFSSW